MPTKQPTPPPAESRIYVHIRGSHPHAGKLGWIKSVDGKVKMINLLGTEMVRVELDDDDACYAELKNLQEFHPTSPPSPRGRKS